MRKIKLGNCDEYALVDDVDYEKLSKEVWNRVIQNGKPRVVCYSVKHNPRLKFSRCSMVTYLYEDSTIKPRYKDGDPLNNQKDNIQVRQQRHPSYTGVYKLPSGRWLAKVIGPAGETYYCGTHNRPIDAARWYNRTAKMLYGIDAKLNKFDSAKGRADAEAHEAKKRGNWAAQKSNTTDNLESRYL